MKRKGKRRVHTLKAINIGQSVAHNGHGFQKKVQMMSLLQAMSYDIPGVPERTLLMRLIKNNKEVPSIFILFYFFNQHSGQNIKDKR